MNAILKSSDQNNFSIFLKCIFVLTVILQIFLNLNTEYGFLTDVPRLSSTSYPGIEFQGLKPFLAAVPVAGYWIDYQSSSPETDSKYVSPYLKAQFCLSPTMLDIQRPLQHQFIVMVSLKNEIDQSLIKSLRAQIVVVYKFSDQRLVITLIRRDRP